MVVLSRGIMSTNWPVLVGAGPLPELSMNQACVALAQRCNTTLNSQPCGACPQDLLASHRSDKSMLRLCGDAARFHPAGSSWLEALADWRQPVLLLVAGEADGGVSGAAAAYTALCRNLGLQLLGLVQLQGPWDGASRRRDGLPWLGWIPDADSADHELGLDALAQRIRAESSMAAAKEATAGQV